jgi:fructuronate reductase
VRLSNATLGRLPAVIAAPAYDRNSCGIGIVHLGIGAFHRCHMAVYTDDVLANAPDDWRILGVSLRSEAIRDQLNPQDGLYTVVVKDRGDTNIRVIGSVAGVLFGPDDPGAVIRAMAKPVTRIISLTVTEKGYCHDPATNDLKEHHPDIVHDLANPDRPRTAIAYLAAGLARRQETDAGPVTIMSCDNLPSNGRTVERIVRRFAELAYPELGEWIDSHVRFPSTKVDRIVPAMERGDADNFTASTGLVDAAVLQTEPFTQWVIEDDFAAGRPAWEIAGATLVEDVRPFEEAKLRMLNGSHSALAYLGYLCGCTYVHEAMAIPALREIVDAFKKREAATSLTRPDGMDLDAYRAKLRDRYDNRALQHRAYQIAMDGSQKIPQRILGTLRHHLKNDGPISACSLALAAWMRYVMAVDEAGNPIIVQDPLADRLKALADSAGRDPEALVDAFLGVEEVFGTDLKTNARLHDELASWLGRLLNDGALKTVEYFAKTG